MSPREEFDHLRALQRDLILFEWRYALVPRTVYYVRRRIIRRMAFLAAVLS